MLELPGGTILGPYESREDWLEARKLGLGGSDIGAVLGLSSFSSPLEVFYSKTEGYQREANEAMEIGSAIEPWILDRWFDSEYRRSENVMDDLVIIQSNTFPFLIHSPDGLLHDRDEVLAGVEIKNIRSDYHWDPLPDFYMAQVQHGLLCSGLDRWIVVALVGGQRMITREIEPDREMMGRIALEAEKFWTAHVLPNVPPEPDGSESASEALNRRWGASQDVSVEIPEADWMNLKHQSDRLKRAEKDYAKAQQVIKSKMGDHERAEVNGEKVATWKVSTRTSVDTKRLREELPDVAKKYEKTSPTRIFRPSL